MDIVQSGMEEKELMRKLRQGEERAFNSIYLMHVKQLMAFTIRTVKSRELAEDIVHDVFVKIWDNREQIDPELPFKPYLYVVTRRHVLNILKRAAHESQIIEEMFKEAISFGNFTDEEVVFQESSTLIKEAITLLPAQRKKVFELCRIKGLTYKQTAEELGISQGTVNDHMVKALRFIKEYLKARNIIALALLYWWW